MPGTGKKKKVTKNTESSDPAYKRGERKFSTREEEEEVFSTMDKTISPEKKKDFESSANNVYSYQKKSFAQVVKGNSFISKTNRAIQGNRREAMCYGALRTLNKDSNPEKQTKNIKKSDTASFPHTDVYDEGTMAVYIKVGCLMTLF